jgi:hypothetical protein
MLPMNRQSKPRPCEKNKRHPLKVHDLTPHKDSKGGNAPPPKVVPGSLQDFFKRDSLPIDN